MNGETIGKIVMYIKWPDGDRTIVRGRLMDVGNVATIHAGGQQVGAEIELKISTEGAAHVHWDKLPLPRRPKGSTS